MTSLKCSINIETLTSKPSDYHLEASPGERRTIAQRLNLVSLEKLEATLRLQKKDELFLTGKIIADVTQHCVRTLVPFSQHIDMAIDEVFVVNQTQEDEEEELELKDLLEPLQGNTLDLGEVVIQFLSLNIDPYPVAPGSEPIDYQEKNGKSSPFDVLKTKK
jgi:uncharacterized metal-binding protein YceD (DUF177 family)